MPTVLMESGFRFFFYSSEGDEPAHIHVTKGDAEGKIWLEPHFQQAYMDSRLQKEKKWLPWRRKTKCILKRDGMSTSTNNYDSLEQLIYQENIRIQSLDVHSEPNMLLILLNTGSVLKEPLSRYSSLSTASVEQLSAYELIGGGVGVHWPDLDEDLSLKGFLKNSLKDAVVNRTNAG